MLLLLLLLHTLQSSVKVLVVTQMRNTKINTEFWVGNNKSSSCKVQVSCEGVRRIWLACCCSNGVHGDVWKLCTSEHQWVPAPLSAHLQHVAGRVAATGIVTDINPVMFLLHGVIPQFRGAARQVGAVWCNLCSDLACTQLYKCSLCMVISAVPGHLNEMCFSALMCLVPLRRRHLDSLLLCHPNAAACPVQGQQPVLHQCHLPQH